ncbi:DNA topoisomerase I [Nanobdella aerobiophila]|uniref:DNA topoisomerase n=1 Tax=Nanobdella aerobiophila TaxID=2586965 RepID=A0A915WRU0_9ARCH|nr:DNA topoisomerase I [Nanobdella aerobiophila]BBL45191.1 DNA topoisomerase I [Nanobdella aerobiophila]
MLIIAEKPSVARKISSFLSNNHFKIIKFTRTISFYYFKKDNKNIYVLPAIGHLYTISDINRKFDYPAFKYQWVPSYYEDRILAKKYYIAMFNKFKNEKEVVVATDYDIEGELIGYNILRFALNNLNAKRMIFSAITYTDILRAYNNLGPINYGYYLAGETRHIVDWLYGINLSRALTKAVRHYNKNIILSMGRVQGPTLKLAFIREKEIENFKPEEYYTINLIVEKDNNQLKFKYIKERLNSREEAKKIKEGLGEYLNVIDIIRKDLNVDPPHPYNLTDIQLDSYRYYKINPKNTLSVLQKLYEKGYISYPRTSSQKIPDTINYKDILNRLYFFDQYKKYIDPLLDKKILRPNNGKKDDVHPAIYPTGLIPKNLDKLERLLYDLIVRRFIATFSDKSEEILYYIKTKEDFYYNYKEIKYKGWMDIYWIFLKEQYRNYNFYKGEKLKILKIDIRKSKTKPPTRYNQASLLKKMEELNLGTKSTRAEILNILFKRGYLYGRSIYITDLGREIIYIFDKYYPEILNIELTRKIEEKLNKLQDRPDESMKEGIINNIIEILSNLLSDFKSKEELIGKEIYEVIKKNYK